MSWTLSILVALLAVGGGQSTEPEGNSLSPSGYHLCVHNETRVVSYLAVHKVPYTVTKNCGGWLLWKTCAVTLYHTVPQTMNKTLTLQVVKCCDGYVPLGRYCAASANRSGELAAKPGSCPIADGPSCPGAGDCEWDVDCPGRQKCCGRPGPGSFCSDPAGSANYSENGGNRWNATVTVKTDHQELMSKDKGLLNHTRLLHAMVTGALQPDPVSVYYLDSWAVPPYRTSTSLLVVSSSSASLQEVTSRLHALLKHIQEVSSVTVEDVDECEEAALHWCSPLAQCNNTVGSYYCTCHQGYIDVDSGNPGAHCTDVVWTSTVTPLTHPPPTASTQEPPGSSSSSSTAASFTTTLSNSGSVPHNSSLQWTSSAPPTASMSSTQETTTCSPPTITTLETSHVTGTSFCVNWSSRSYSNQTYVVLLRKGSEVTDWWETNTTMMKVGGLEPGVLYNITVTPHACGSEGVSGHVLVKTDAQTVDATARLTNINFSADLHNSSSQAYKNLTASFIQEIYQSLSPEMKALVDSGQVRIQIRGFSQGSVLVNFTLVLTLSPSQDIANVSEALLTSLMNSSKYTVDKNNTSITDVDECVSGDNDCSKWATCNNTFGSYTCVCGEAFEDNDLLRPGRACRANVTAETTTPALTTVTGTWETTTAMSTTQTVFTTVSVPTLVSTTLATVTSTDAPTTNPATAAFVQTTTTVASTTSTAASVTTTVAAAATTTTTTTIPTTTTVSPTAAPATTTATPQTTTTTTAPATTAAAPATTTLTPTATTDSTSTAVQTTTTMTTAAITTALTTTTSTNPTTSTTNPTTTITNPTTSTTNPTTTITNPTTTTTNPTTTITNPTTTITNPTTTTTNPTTTTTNPTTTTTNPTTTITNPTTTITNPTTTTVASTASMASPATTTATSQTTTSTTAPTTNATAPATTATAPATTTATSQTTTTTTAPTTTATAPATTATEPATTTTAPATTTATAQITITTTAPTTTATAQAPTTTPPSTTTAASTTSTADLATTAAAPATTTPTPTATTDSTSTAVQTTTTTTPVAITTFLTTTTTTRSPTTLPTPMATSTTTVPTTTANPTTTTVAVITVTPTTTSMTSPPMTSSVSPQRTLSVQGAVSVECRLTAVTVSVARDYLEENKLSESNLYLGEVGCGVNGGNATHVQLTVAWNECAAKLTHNESVYTLSVTLLNTMDPHTLPSGTVEVPRARLEVPVMCPYMKSMLISADFNAMGYDIIKDVIMGLGSFQVTVRLMNGTMPLQQNYSLSPEDEVVVEVSLNTSSEQIKVIINKCWATPTANPAHTQTITFLENSCSINPYTHVLTNGNSSTSRVSVQIFSFVNLDVIYLHCQVFICVETGADSCVPDCLQRTSRTSANKVGSTFRSVGPLQRMFTGFPEEREEPWETVHIIGFACLGVGLTLFFILAFVCLFFYQRNRIGNYNFNVKPKQENFTYLVFNT